MQGFADLPTADTRFNGVPSPAALAQGYLKDCWFVAAAAGLANAVPTQLQAGLGVGSTPIIADAGPVAGGGGAELYRVTFPGRAAVSVPFTPGETYANASDPAHRLSLSRNPGNGDWAAILEKAWAEVMAPSASWTDAINQVLNSPTYPDVAIRGLTGNSADYYTFFFTRSSTIASRLNTVNNNYLIVATESSRTDGKNTYGLVPGCHAYTVMAYNAATEMVQLRNPWGVNEVNYQQVYRDYNTLAQPAGWYAENTPARGGGNASFWMTLAEFNTLFRRLDYEYVG